MKKTNDSAGQKKSHPIPDVEILDLENLEEDAADSADAAEDLEEGQSEESDETTEQETPKKRFRFNIHMALILMVVIFIGGIVYRFFNWGEFIDLDEIFKDGQGTYEDTYDEILPLVGEDGTVIPINYEDGLSIVAFGNAPFADDRDSASGLLNLIAEESDATIYNCSVTGSYMAAQSGVFSDDIAPMDAYTLYWLATVAVGMDGAEGKYSGVAEALGENLPPDAEEAFNTLTSIDFDTVDVITVMYDATDYLLGHNMYNFDNPTDITHFAGNLEAGLELFQSIYPHIRIIVMGPTYAYGLDENGEYVSSDIQRYGEQDVLSVYSIMEWNSCASRSVSFVDHLYGTITADNADEYLVDHVHLNQAGREKVAERFLTTLHYFDYVNE